MSGVDRSGVDRSGVCPPTVISATVVVADGLFDAPRTSLDADEGEHSHAPTDSTMMPSPEPEKLFSPDLSAYFRSHEGDASGSMPSSSLQLHEPPIATTTSLLLARDTILDPLNSALHVHGLRHDVVSHQDLWHPAATPAHLASSMAMTTSSAPSSALRKKPPMHLHGLQVAHDASGDSPTTHSRRTSFVLTSGTTGGVVTDAPRQTTHSGQSPFQPSRNLYASSNPCVRFVASYSAAISGCMKQSQLVNRDPLVVGRLLHYFIGSFLRKYWRAALTLVATVTLIECTSQRWLFSWSPLALLVWLVMQVSLMRSRLTCELASAVPLHTFQFFKHPRLISRARALPVARAYATNGTPFTSTPGTPGGSTHGHGHGHADIFFQPSEGYCGQASLNNVLSSLPLPVPASTPTGTPVVTSPAVSFVARRFFVAMPPIVRPFALTEMEVYVRELIAASGLLAAAIERIDLIADWSDRSDSAHQKAHESGYTEFLAHMSSQVNDPRYRFLANFSRTPLFFCEEARDTPLIGANAVDAVKTSSSPTTPSVSLPRKLFSGHWSPVVAYLDASEVERVLFRGSATPQSGTPVYTYPPSPALGRRTPRAMAAHGSPQRTPRLATVSALATRPNGLIRTPPQAIACRSTLTPPTTAAESITATAADATSMTHAADGLGEMIAASSTPTSSLSSESTSNGGAVHPSSSATNLASSATGLRARNNAVPPSLAATASSATSSPAGLPPSAGSAPLPVGSLSRATSDAALHYANYLSATAASSVACHATERTAVADGLLLVADVNPAYAHYLLPPRRLFDACRTVNLNDGEPRGIIRFTIKSQ